VQAHEHPAIAGPLPVGIGASIAIDAARPQCQQPPESSIFSLRFSSMFLGGKIEVLQETATRLNRVQLDRLPTAATQEVY
jgi:hypothetical protein